MKRIIIYLLIVVLASCKKENQPPTCEITYPENNATFSIGDTFTVSVEANDPDGLVHEVQLFVDGIGLVALTDFPYNYTLDTKAYVPGEYNIKATALDEQGLSSSDEINISIDALLPTATTSEVTFITDTTAISGGEVTDDGGAEVTSKGVCWDVNPNPTINSNHTEDGSGLGEYISEISGLEPNTLYYVRAYALNTAGIAYGNEINFTSLPPKEYVVDFDGNIYSTVQIGEQIWMAENLKVTHYADGTAIPNITDDITWANLGSSAKAYCFYDNSVENGNTYGSLYTWAAAVNGAPGCNGVDCSSSSDAECAVPIQGVCPSGWHVPSHYEWTVLLKEVETLNDDFPCDESSIGSFGGDAGGNLKTVGTTYWNDPNVGSTNSSGFSALGSGKRVEDGSFSHLGEFTLFWSSSEYSSTRAWGRNLYSAHTQVYVSRYYKIIGRSVRCVKD